MSISTILSIVFLFFLFQVTISLNTHKLKSGSLTKSTNTKSRVQEILKTCPNKASLIQNPQYVKSSNGCGPAGNDWLRAVGQKLSPHFQGCCTGHDICYDTCDLKIKKKCDDDFGKCMKDVCDSKYNNSYFKRVACKTQGTAMYGAVKMFGENAFIAAQNKSCMCSSS